jgi:hypothetical protein
MLRITIALTVLALVQDWADAQRADGQPDMPTPAGMCSAEDALSKDEVSNLQPPHTG